MALWDLVITAEDYTHADADVDYIVPKTGDVIEARPHGWPWSKTELNDPRWRIITVDMLDSEVAALLVDPRTDQLMKQPVRFRKYQLTVDPKQFAKGEVVDAKQAVMSSAIELKAELVKSEVKP